MMWPLWAVFLVLRKYIFLHALESLPVLRLYKRHKENTDAEK